jgi:hypothetical protein
MTSNKAYNQKQVEKYRRILRSYFGDIRQIDAKCLNKAVNIGKADAIKNTPVGDYPHAVDFYTREGKHVHFDVKTVKMGGFMRRSWKSSRIRRAGKVITKVLYNTADYASYVNDGHRVVNKSGETVGWIEGDFMLERAMHVVETNLAAEFQKEVIKVGKKYVK